MALEDKQWLLAELVGEPVAAEPAPYFEIDAAEWRVFGSGGCNRFTGSVDASGEELRFGPIAATRMACVEPVMRLEAAFFDALASVTRYELDGERLVLLDGDTVVARLTGVVER